MSRKALLLVALVMLLATTASGALWLQSERSSAQLREQVMRQAEQRSLHLADAMSGQVGAIVSLLDLKLLDLRRAWLQDPATFDFVAEEIISVNRLDYVAYVTVVDTGGNILYDSQSDEPSVNAFSHEIFQRQKEQGLKGTDQLLIGKPVRSRKVGEWVFILNRPLFRDGTFVGVIAVAVSTTKVADRLAALELSESDVVALVHPDGAFLARSKGNGEAMGESLPASRPYLADPGLRSGIFSLASKVDGIRRTYGWHRLEPHGLVLVIGLADASVLAPLAPAFDRAQRVSGALTVLLLACGALISLLLWRNQRSQSLLQAQEQFRHRLFDSSLVPIVVMDAETATLVDCNMAAVRIYGHTDRNSVQHGRPLMFSAPVQYDGTPAAEKARTYIREAIERGSVVFEWLHQRPDGTRWDAEVRMVGFESEGRWLLQFTLQDITDRRKAEAALRLSEFRLKEAQRLARVGHWESDPHTRRIVWSDELFRIFEVPPDHVPTPKGFMELVHPDDRDMVIQAYERSLKENGSFELVHRIVVAGGRVKHVRESGYNEFEHGRLLRSVGTVQDITEVKQAEDTLKRINEELEQRVAERTREMSTLNRDLEAFSYSVSHDLRTPLRSLDGYASLLETEFGDRLDDEGRGFLLRIRQAARRMTNLINDMLTMAQLNRADLRRQQLDLSELASSVVADIMATEPHRTVRWHIQDGLVVQADPSLMHAVLQNLLSNAWKYSSRTPDAHISFSAERLSDGSIEYQVRDNGAGFDMAYVDQLFQPFKRLHPQHEFEGTGVGLASVQRIIERHGGRVRAEGAVGQGALFAFTLPARA